MLPPSQTASMHDMPSRRDFLRLSIATGAAPLAACSGSDAMADYLDAAARMRALIAETPDIGALVRYATLAANSHNTQPWRFSMRESGVSIEPDMARRTPVVDPDDHHLFVSLGCAAENFLIASAAHGRPGALNFEAVGDGRLDIDLSSATARSDVLYDAIPHRQSTRSEYDAQPIAVADLRQLEAASAVDGVSLILITDGVGREAVVDHVIAGNGAQMDDPAFVAELRDWIRFNPTAAMETGDGLFSATTGNPSIPTWFGRMVFDWFFDKETENEKYAKQIRSSAGVAVFVGEKDDREHWVRVGRSFQRFALQATALGIRTAHVNQPIEVANVRPVFAGWLGIGEARPDLVVRFGTAPPMPMSLRRPVSAVLAPSI